MTGGAVVVRRSLLFLLLGVLGWIVLALAGAVLASGAFSLGAYLLRWNAGWQQLPAPSFVLNVVVGASGFQITLLLGALRQGRRSGGGDRCAGLGAGPIRRKGAVIGLCLIMLVCLGGLMVLISAFPILRDLAKSATTDLLSGLGDAGPGVVVLTFGLLAVLAPVSEELFFRGWFWEALRRRGHGVGVTACLTAIPWLLLHGLDSPGRVLFLLPAAIMLSVARHLGGGVRASLAVHVTNNAAAVLAQMVALIFR